MCNDYNVAAFKKILRYSLSIDDELIIKWKSIVIYAGIIPLTKKGIILISY